MSQLVTRISLSLIGLLWVSTAPAEPYLIAVLQGLDKVTARISTLHAPVGQTVRFGTFDILARTCDKRPPEDPPESAAFLEIIDQRINQEPVDLFKGWMFASSPALNAVEHPVYDVWVVDCVKSAAKASESLESKAPE